MPLNADFESGATAHVEAPSRDSTVEENAEFSQEMEHPVAEITREEEENVINSGVGITMACEYGVSSDRVLIVDTFREDTQQSHQVCISKSVLLCHYIYGLYCICIRFLSVR